jgi:hypothetical protein
MSIAELPSGKCPEQAVSPEVAGEEISTIIQVSPSQEGKTSVCCGIY